jgi:hypothetical protein
MLSAPAHDPQDGRRFAVLMLGLSALIFLAILWDQRQNSAE